MSKRVTFGARPSSHAVAAGDADSWVKSREAGEAEKQPMKRLTVDLPAELHARVKAQCAMRGVKISDEIRAMLEERFKSRVT